MKPPANKICQEYYQTNIRKVPPLYQGLDSLMYGAWGIFRRYVRSEKRMLQKAHHIHEHAQPLRDLSDSVLKDQLEKLRSQIRCCRQDDADLHAKALAHLTEAAYRSLGLRPFPVQIMGSLSLLNGFLAEMATGEGKTLTAALSAVIAGWKGKPCHIITGNDYLADRDSNELAPFYHYCHVDVGSVISTMSPQERQLNYAQNVVYTTSKEILADFLRDRLKLGSCHHPGLRLIKSFNSFQKKHSDDLVMRGLHTAIVDEADSVLIDEAVTPLIISRPMTNEPLKQAIQIAQIILPDILPNIHYKRIDKYKEIRLTDSGKKFLNNGKEKFPGIWRGQSRQEEIINLSLQAREWFHRDKHYVIQDNKVVIVDEFTGRLMPSRSWSHGLHQAVEAKEGVEITDPMETLARLSFQRFFRFFPKLSGMTGTAWEASGEFWQIYRLPVISIPTNRPCIRKQLPDQMFSSLEKKLKKIVKEIVRIHQTERPILVGTRNVEASEKLALLLNETGLDCQIINAVRHEAEAQIVAQAGGKNRITIATNMAGRGTDIKLGPDVTSLGGLHVIATERHESARIDRQLFGRCARQGNPGSAQAFISLEDDLIQRFVPQFIQKRIRGTYTDIASRLMGRRLYGYAQKMAEKFAYQQRKSVLHSDKWLSQALSFTGSELDFY
ncbi:MAG: preprotein translocase subunit SecA [Candidatus Magnetomorum sp.]|nr:preprotein translocase subunit SecA [Candidatus Magnetomorum sp.]